MSRTNQSSVTCSLIVLDVRSSFCSLSFGLGSGSDYLGFDQLVGSSNMDARYTFNAAEQGIMDSYPLYHTSYEAFSTMKRFVDPEFTVKLSTSSDSSVSLKLMRYVGSPNHGTILGCLGFGSVWNTSDATQCHAVHRRSARRTERIATSEHLSSR